MHHITKSSLGKTIFSGTILLSAFYVPYAWPLVFFALVPFFSALTQTNSKTKATLLGVLYGGIIAGGTSFWYFSATPIISEIGPIANFALILACWLAMVLALAPCVGFFALLAHISPRTGYLGYILIPTVWVVFEFFRMVAFLFVTFAPGVENPAFYSTGFIGYPLADSSVWIQLAAYGGIYLMSFVVVFVNYLVFRVSSLPKQGVVWLRKGIIIGVVVSLLPVVELKEQFVRDETASKVAIGIMSVSIPEEDLGPEYKAHPVFKEQIRESVATLSQAGAQIILLPEGGGFLRPAPTGALAVPIVIDVLGKNNSYGVFENVAYVGSVDGEAIAPIRAKSIVTPQGEYLIGLTELLAPLFGYESKVKEIAERVTVSTAAWGSSIAVPGTTLTGSIIFCIEMIAPWFGATLADQQGSDFLLVTISQGRFKNPYSLSVDTLRFLKVRAVEAGRPIVSSADHAPAYSIDSFGRVKEVIGESGESEYEVVTVTTHEK